MHKRKSPRMASESSPATDVDVPKDTPEQQRQELGQLIGRLLARRWLRHRRMGSALGEKGDED